MPFFSVLPGMIPIPQGFEGVCLVEFDMSQLVDLSFFILRRKKKDEKNKKKKRWRPPHSLTDEDGRFFLSFQTSTKKNTLKKKAARLRPPRRDRGPLLPRPASSSSSPGSRRGVLRRG